MRNITHAEGVWVKIAGEDAAWVASDDERLARALAAHFDCPIHDMEEGQRRLAHATRAAEAGVKPEDLDPDDPELTSPDNSDRQTEGEAH
jgi:hypothetical protein